MSKTELKDNNINYICNILTTEPLTQIIRDFQPKSASERYRRFKNPLSYDLPQKNPYIFMQRLKRYYLAREDVDLNVIRPITFEVSLIVKIFFLKLNNSHLPKKFEVFLEELKKRTRESRKKENINFNLKNLGEPPEKPDKERVSPLIEEGSSLPSSININTSLLNKNGGPKMVENNSNLSIEQELFTDGEKICEECPKKLTKESCTYCNYFLLYEREVTDIYVTVEPDLEDFYSALEQDIEQNIGTESSQEDLLECSSKENAETEISDADNDKVVVKNPKKFENKLKNLKKLAKPKRQHIEFPVIPTVKKTVNKVLDITVNKRRRERFINNLKNASVSEVLIETSLSATQPEKDLQEKVHDYMTTTISHKKIAEIIRVRPENALEHSWNNNKTKTLVKNIGIISLLCVLLLPRFLWTPELQFSTDFSFFNAIFLGTSFFVLSYCAIFFLKLLLFRKDKPKFLSKIPIVKSLRTFRSNLESKGLKFYKQRKSAPYFYEYMDKSVYNKDKKILKKESLIASVDNSEAISQVADKSTIKLNLFETFINLSYFRKIMESKSSIKDNRPKLRVLKSEIIRFDNILTSSGNIEDSKETINKDKKQIKEENIRSQVELYFKGKRVKNGKTNYCSQEELEARNEIKAVIEYNRTTSVKEVIESKKTYNNKLKEWYKDNEKELSNKKSYNDKLKAWRRKRKEKIGTKKEKKALSSKKARFNIKNLASVLQRLLIPLAVFLLAFMVLISSDILLFTRDIIISFTFLIALIPALYVSIITAKLILSKKKTIILASVPILALLGVIIFVVIGLENYAGFIVFASVILSYGLVSNQVKINRTKKLKFPQMNLDYYRLLYHRHKFFLLGTTLLILGLVFVSLFILAPQNLAIPNVLIVAFILLLTVKSKSHMRRLIILHKKKKLRKKNISHKSFLILYEDRNVRAALLILIFLIFMPLLFTVNSMISIDTPFMSFGRVDQNTRIESSSVDFSLLDYAQDFDALGEISINDEFVVHTIINTEFGESSIMRVRIIPESIPNVYNDLSQFERSYGDIKSLAENGMRLKYDVLSDYVAGPLTEADYYNPVELNELDLLPGRYSVECYYSIRTGWSMRRAYPEIYTLNLEKDNLKILPTRPFDLPVEYGAVYTFENTNESSWETFFDGKLVNSINEPIAGKKIDLFLEINDKYEKIATVETDAEGDFYHHHKIYGWVEDRMLAKIEYRDDDLLYKILVHEEYAGLEEPVDGDWFFFDQDGDGYPDWNYSLWDLLGLYMSGTLGYSMPIQPDDFTFATGNFYGQYGDLEFSDLSASTIQSESLGVNHKIDVEIEWGIDDDVESMEYLRWDYSTSESPNVDFSIWNYNLQVYEVKTSSPFALTSDYYDAANNNTVRARIESVLKGTAYELYLDQLRIDYILGAPPEPLPTLAFMALFDEDQGDTTIDDVNDLVGTLYGNTSWTDGKHNSSLFFDGTGQVTIEEGAPQTNYLTPIQAVSPSGEFTFTYGSFVSTGDIELDDGSETNIISQKIDNSYHEIDVVVEWGPQGIVDTMDYLHWAHRFEWVVTPTTDFQIWNYALNGGSGDWETVTQNPFSLTSDYYDQNNNVKVRYYAHADGRTSVIDLFIDQLRLEYTNTSVSETQYADFDWVDFGDVLDDVLGPGSTNDEFVITGWINPSAFTSNQSIHGIKNVFFSKENIELGINESGYLQVYINTDGVETTAYYGTDNSIGTNDWIYFALRYNNSDIDVFLDEVWYYDAIGAVAEPWSGGGSLVNGGSLIIGAELTAYSCFTGKIDDLSVFREAISHFDIEAHKGGLGSLEINATVSIEDGLGGWEPIATSGDIMDGYLNFEMTSMGIEINNTQFYMSDVEPDLQNPTPQDWTLITEYCYDSNYYSTVISSRDIPDGSWYFIARANDSDSNFLYDAWVISETIAYFGIDSFLNRLILPIWTLKMKSISIRKLASFLAKNLKIKLLN